MCSSDLRVVQLLHDELPPGITLLHTAVHGSGVEAQVFATTGQMKALLINKTRSTITVELPVPKGAQARTVDMDTGSLPVQTIQIENSHLILKPQAVVVVSWPSV